MTSQQPPRRWFSLALFSRPMQPPPQRPPTQTTNPQQPITRTQTLQLRPPASRPVPSPGQTRSPPTAPTSPPGPSVSTLIASSAPPSPTSPKPASTPPQRSLKAMEVPRPTAPASKSPPASVAKPTLQATLQPITPAARVPSLVTPSPRAPSASTRYSTTLQPQTNKSKPTSQTTKTLIPLQTSFNKPTSPATATFINHAHTQVSSPKTIKTSKTNTHESPEIKGITRPPSPSTLPPSQAKPKSDYGSEILTETEQKTIIVHDKNWKSKLTPGNSTDFKLEKNIKYNDQNEKDTHNKIFGLGKYGSRIITIAGENRGAIMELSSSNKEANSNGWRINCAHNNKEERPNIKDKDTKKIEMQEQQPKTKTVFINNNVQQVNNSIVSNGHFTADDPGVYIS